MNADLETTKLAAQKILIIDDSALTLEVTKMKLEAAGFDVVTLDSPFGFSAALREERPDLVLVDVSMPALQGDQLVKIARRYQTSRPPSGHGGKVSKRSRALIVLHSDRSDRELGDLVERSGADAFIRKTPETRLLVDKVRALLSKRDG